MGNNAPSYLCDVCKGEFKFEDIRYSADGRKIVCRQCHAKALKKKEKLHEPSSGTVKLICGKCRYKFSLKKNTRVNLICPYCGSDNLMRDETTADKLIEEASRDS